MVNPIPEGFHTVTPYLLVEGCAGLIEFLKAGFSAAETSRHAWPDGRIMNAQMKIGSSMVMLGDAPAGYPPMKSMLYLYVPDVDAVYNRAVAAGGKVVAAPVDQFYGDRSGAVSDPCGNVWWISTRKEDVREEDLAMRARAAKK